MNRQHLSEFLLLPSDKGSGQRWSCPREYLISSRPVRFSWGPRSQDGRPRWPTRFQYQINTVYQFDLLCQYFCVRYVLLFLILGSWIVHLCVPEIKYTIEISCRLKQIILTSLIQFDQSREAQYLLRGNVRYHPYASLWFVCFSEK